MARPIDEYASDSAAAKYYAQVRRIFHVTGCDGRLLMTRNGWCEASLESIAMSSARTLHQMLVDGTPEDVVQAVRFVAIDGFCGMGVNTIALARVFDHVIAIDSDPEAVTCTRRNCDVYNVARKVTLFTCDIYSPEAVRLVRAFLLEQASAGVAIRLAAHFSPPWGGTAYALAPHFRLDCPPAAKDCVTLPALALRFGADALALYVPRNTLVYVFALQVADATSTPPQELEGTLNVVTHTINGKIKAMTLYANATPTKSQGQTKRRRVELSLLLDADVLEADRRGSSILDAGRLPPQVVRGTRN